MKDNIAEENGWDDVTDTKHHTAMPRIAVPSLRSLHSHVSRSYAYELEDVIAEHLDAADIFDLTPKGGASSKVIGTLKNRLSFRTSLVSGMPNGLISAPAEQDYDLFFYAVANMRDLNALSAIPNWRKRSKMAICWILELWIKDLDHFRRLIDRLNEFDVVLVAMQETAEVLQERLKVPVHYLPGGLDVLRFAPVDNPPKRVIDVMTFGGRDAETHAALLDWARETGRYYVYDSTKGRADMPDYRAHRQKFIDEMQRSRYFCAYIAKMQRTAQRAEQSQFGIRYFEGLAAGTVILGNNVDSDAFRKHLQWEDSVIEVPFKCPDMGRVINELDAQPDRIAAARRRNIIESLRRHDHYYRWQAILDLAGLPESPHMAERKARIDAAIATLEQAAG